MTYQIVAWSQSQDEAESLLAEDFAAFGGGTLESIRLHREWDVFPYVEAAALAVGFYDRFEAPQGANGALYVGGFLAFDPVERNALYTRELVAECFPPMGR